MSKKVLGIILNFLIVIVVLVVILAIYSVIQTKVLKKEYVNFCGFTVFQVATGSMSGSMEEKDIIIVKFLNEEQTQNLQVNDIIIFKQEGYIITHRIVKIEEDNITTKGDANNTEDNPIKRNAIIGKVVQIMPNIGIWEKVFTTPKVYISIIITIVLLGITFLYNSEKTINTGGEKTDGEKTDGEKTNEEKADKEK